MLIVLDDLDVKSLRVMTRTLKLLANQGVTFENMFVTSPLCCPSRVSILTGRYPHNHGILTNGPPHGGFSKFRAAGGESSTIATWLRAVGYRTAYFGRYLNGYWDDPTHVPPGWDEWHAVVSGSYYGYRLNENGHVIDYGDSPGHYEADVLAAKAVSFIKQAKANAAQPFFMHIAPTAPHWPTNPAKRHQRQFAGLSVPRPPSFNEADVGDKPAWLRQLPPLGPSKLAELDVAYRKRLQSLLAVDEAVEKLVKALADGGELDHTVILFTSDNGFHLGEHRLYDSKRTPYEEAIRVPLIVRGPRIARGRTLSHMVLNIDLAPTIAQLAGAGGAESADGRSLVPLLGNVPPPPEAWRKDFLIEHWAEGGQKLQERLPDYHALRTRDYLFVEYATGEIELYDLRTDPFQIKSLHNSVAPSLVKQLSDRLDALKKCAAAACRE